MMNVPHHGLNLYTHDLYHYRCNTLLYCSPNLFTYWDEETRQNNLELIRCAQEYLSYADGGKKLTFPYTVGSYETIDPWYPQQSIGWTEKQKSNLIKYGLQE